MGSLQCRHIFNRAVSYQSNPIQMQDFLNLCRPVFIHTQPQPREGYTHRRSIAKLSTMMFVVALFSLCIAPTTLAAFVPQHHASRISSSASSSSSVTFLSAKKKVFIDGEVGTTGIQVRDRLSQREDIELISPPTELRKDPETRKKYINDADAVILCKNKT
jgi:hypothetical protein